MATLFWQGGATAVQMAATQTFATYDTNTTRTITIGGVAISRADTTDLATSLTALAVLLNASTHPYFSSITWTSTATTIKGTADVAGCFFTMVGSVSGGTGTVANSGVQSVTTANAGPNDWSTIANWYTALGTPSAALPASNDTVILANNAVNICWGLATGVTGVTIIRQELTYTGKIGLDYKSFATSSDGATVNTSYPEYRALYVAIGCVSYRHGDNPTFGSAAGSSRSLWDFGTTTACTMDVINTCANTSEANRPCLRLLGVKSTHSLNVRSAPGGVGIANEVPGEVSTMIVNIADTSSTSKVVTGPGFTLITWSQSGGNNVLFSNVTMPTITVTGGTLRLEGTGAVTTLNCYAGTVNSNNSGTTATINLQGGNLSGFGSSVARTWSTLNIYPDSSVSYDPAVVTVTAFTGQRRLTLATS